MKIVGLCEKVELAVGLRLAGIDCQVLENNDVMKKIEEISKNKEIGIVVLTENIYNLAEEDITKFKKNNNLPLIVKIPSKGI